MPANHDLWRSMHNNPIRQFEDYLAARGQRMTTERLLIVGKVLTTFCPFTANELTESLVLVSRATVYRTLNLLVEAGLVQRQLSHDGRETFSHKFTGAALAEQLLGHRARRMAMYGALCETAHRKSIVGRCPWCGESFINSERRSGMA